MSNNITREEHLAALATAARNFALTTQNSMLGLVVEALQVAGGSSAVSTTKITPTLSIGSWTKNDTTYTATISYDGDGELSTNLGSISGTTLTVTDADGTFAGTVTAAEGSTYAASTLNFSYNTTAATVQKTAPTLTVENRFDMRTDLETTTVSYNGDGTLYLFDFTGDAQAKITGTTLTVADKTGTFKVGATEGTNYAASTPVTVSVTDSGAGGEGSDDPVSPDPVSPDPVGPE